METLLQTALDLLCGAAAASIAFVLGYALTEWRGPLAGFKPLNCRPCLTFWLALLIGGVAALWLREAPSTVILYAFINFIYLSTNIKIVE